MEYFDKYILSKILVNPQNIRHSHTVNTSVFQKVIYKNCYAIKKIVYEINI